MILPKKTRGKAKKKKEPKVPALRKNSAGVNRLPFLEPGDRIIKPNSRPQLEFIQSTAYEAFYCGGAGSGKTYALIMAAAKNYQNKNYQAVIFRNTMGEVTRVLIHESSKIYPFLGAIYNHRTNCWNFPSGAKIYLSYMDQNKDIQRHLGAEYQFVGFDELVTFEEAHFTGLMKRLRTSTDGNPRVIRATSNPYADWVFYRYNHWLNHNHKACVEEQEITGIPSCPENGVIRNVSGIITQVFMGTCLDNYDLMLHSPEYVATLKSGSKEEVTKYFYNDWTIKPSPGIYFKREMFEFVDSAPVEAKRIRGWDLAATLKGDYTVGVRLAYLNGIYYIEDVVRDRLEPDNVVKLIINTAELDGKGVAISFPKEPAGSGQFLSAQLSKLLNGYNFSFRSEHVDRRSMLPSTTAKESKALGLSSQCASKNVKIVRGKWNAKFLEELEEFPLGKYDDQVDAVCGGYNSTIGQTYVKYNRFPRNLRPRQF